MGKTLPRVCVCVRVCMNVCVPLLKHKSFCQQWQAALTCDDERRQQQQRGNGSPSDTPQGRTGCG